jgi:maltooligosyltrehalose trehalohydrolase
LRRAVFEGRKKEFREFAAHKNIPDPGDPETFAKSKINWKEIDDTRSEQAAMLQWYRSLLTLRRERPELTDGDLRKVHVTFDEKERWLVMRRDAVQVMCNLGKDEQKLPVDVGAKVLLASEHGIALGWGHITLPAMSVAILELNG